MSKLDAKKLPRNSEESPMRNYVVAPIALLPWSDNNIGQLT